MLLRSATAQMVGRLMDAVEPEMVDEVERIARGTPGVVDVERIRLRWVGHALETNLSITVDQDLTVMGGHAISEEVRHRLLHQVSKLDTVVIHVNPCDHGGVRSPPGRAPPRGPERPLIGRVLEPSPAPPRPAPPRLAPPRPDIPPRTLRFRRATFDRVLDSAVASARPRTRQSIPSAHIPSRRGTVESQRE